MRCKGRLALPKGEGEGEGCSMRLVRVRNSNPSPQSSPLAKGRGGTTAVELRANEQYLA
jgi:hypothetical protein